jgi:hypothetical protein
VSGPEPSGAGGCVGALIGLVALVALILMSWPTDSERREWRQRVANIEREALR